MTPAHLRIATATFVAYIVRATNLDTSSECSNQGTCRAGSPTAQTPHHALLQVRNRLSSTFIGQEGLHGSVPGAPLPAESLVDVSVFKPAEHDSKFGLTDFEKDYIVDSSNPLDAAYSKAIEAGADVSPNSTVTQPGAGSAGAAPAGQAAGAAAGSAGTAAAAAAAAGAAAGTATGSTTACCEEHTAKCLACKNGLTIESYCLMNGTAPGCESAFDCAAGFDKRELGWSELKKSWCCINKKVGCLHAANGTVASVPGDDRDFLFDGETPNASVSPAPTPAPEVVPRCVTRRDPRATSFGYTTSLPGTPCVFGVDDRDEGSHCIMESGKFGSFGWCWTSREMNSWGSCSETCPLFGPSKVLGERIKTLEQKLQDALTTTTTTTTTVATTTSTSVANLTNATNVTKVGKNETSAPSKGGSKSTAGGKGGKAAKGSKGGKGTAGASGPGGNGGKGTAGASGPGSSSEATGGPGSSSEATGKGPGEKAADSSSPDAGPSKPTEDN